MCYIEDVYRMRRPADVGFILLLTTNLTRLRLCKVFATSVLQNLCPEAITNFLSFLTIFLLSRGAIVINDVCLIGKESGAQHVTAFDPFVQSMYQEAV